jgi:hypothetical protein
MAHVTFIHGISQQRLTQRPDGEIDLSATELQSMSREPVPDNSQLEAVLGVAGPKTYKRWQLGPQRALSVALIRHPLVGTGRVRTSVRRTERAL